MCFTCTTFTLARYNYAMVRPSLCMSQGPGVHVSKRLNGLSSFFLLQKTPSAYLSYTLFKRESNIYHNKGCLLRNLKNSFQHVCRRIKCCYSSVLQCASTFVYSNIGAVRWGSSVRQLRLNNWSHFSCLVETAICLLFNRRMLCCMPFAERVIRRTWKPRGRTRWN